MLRDANAPLEFEHQVADARAHARAELTEQANRIDIEIQKAILDGIIGAEAAARLEAGVTAIEPNEILRFQPATTTLELIERAVHHSRGQRLADLRKEWEHLSFRLAGDLVEDEAGRPDSSLCRKCLRA